VGLWRSSVDWITKLIMGLMRFPSLASSSSVISGVVNRSTGGDEREGVLSCCTLPQETSLLLEVQVIQTLISSPPLHESLICVSALFAIAYSSKLWHDV